jgi:hypothetical protein
MTLYERVIMLLLEESERLSDIPNEDVLRSDLVVVDPNGIRYTIKKVVKDKKGKRHYQLCRGKYSEYVDFQKLKKFKRA